MTASGSASPPSDCTPVGFRGLKGLVLAELKRGRGTARELAHRLGVSVTGVRHHLKDLQADGFVLHETVARGVGAPVHIYGLSIQGEDLFPRRYRETLEYLLDYVIARDGRDAAAAALQSHFDALGERLVAELGSATAEERMTAVVRSLSDAGYMAEGRTSLSSGTLTEHNCAMRGVAQRFPEICAAEARFLAVVLGGTVERRKHMLGGCDACEYKVEFSQERV